MSVPPKRRPKSGTRKRRSHHGLKPTTLVKCAKCGKPVKPHIACAFCGVYKGREAIKIKTLAKKTKK
jgi:large subunit ribosomal protein L32